MGTVKGYKQTYTHTHRVVSSKPLISKGDRLGWVSIEDVETVDLNKVLTNGRVVKLKTNTRPMLVP